MRRISQFRTLPIFLVCIGSLVYAAQSHSQSQIHNPAPPDAAVQLPSFEVAAIRPNRSGEPWYRVNTPPGRFTATNISVEALIERAFYLQENQISGAPRWTGSDRYDIEAKMSDSQYQAIDKLDKRQQEHQVSLMLQSLLADRFKLAVSHHPKELKVYALVVAKGGPKLIAAGTPEAAKPKPSYNSGGSFSGVVLNLMDSQVGAFAAGLSGIFGQTVVDQTGLSGSYDITFQVPIDPEGDRESQISTALQDQLGLRITSQKATVDTIVIEHVEAPSEN
jgi:uncharacterized protein (TIGR03435 family)